MIVAVLIALVIFSERLPHGYFMSDTHAYDFVPFLKRTAGSAILVLPLETKSATSNNLFMIRTGKSIVDGYTHRALDTPARRSFLTANHLDVFSCDFHDPAGAPPVSDQRPPAASRIAAAGITYVAINNKTYADPRCGSAKRAIDAFVKPLRLIHAYGDGSVYALQ